MCGVSEEVAGELVEVEMREGGGGGKGDVIVVVVGAVVEGE